MLILIHTWAFYLYHFFLCLYIYTLAGSWRARHKNWSSKSFKCNDKTLLSRRMLPLYLLFLILHPAFFDLICLNIPANHLQLSASLGLGVQYDKREKLRYVVRGKKAFPVTTNGLVNFHVKGRCDIGKDFIQVGVLLFYKLRQIYSLVR